MRELLSDMADASIVVLSLIALVRYARGERLTWTRREPRNRP